MNIYYIQKLWFSEKYYADTTVHKHYLTVQLPKINIDTQIWLTIFSPGVNLDAGVGGIAAAGIKSYRYEDDQGKSQFVELDHWESHLRQSRCLEVTYAFHVRLAWAKAEGMIYWHD